jgi:hypothetical protein
VAAWLHCGAVGAVDAAITTLEPPCEQLLAAVGRVLPRGLGGGGGAVLSYIINSRSYLEN